MHYSSVMAEPGLRAHLPLEVERLFPREKEIATLVYSRGLVTAVDVEQDLSEPICNAAVRSMLNRLVRKGVLSRAKCGRGGAFVYGPGITQAAAREKALRRFADEFFEGSLEGLAKAVARLSATARPADAISLRRTS